MFPHCTTISIVHDVRRQDYLREAARERLAATAVLPRRSRLTPLAACRWLQVAMNARESGQRQRAIGASLGIVAVACLATASTIAGLYWQPLLVEQAAGVVRSGEFVGGLARIAPGLPVVSIAGGLGALACLVFVAALLAGLGTRSRLTDEIPRSSE